MGFYNEDFGNCVLGSFDLAFDIDAEERGINFLDADSHLLQRTMVQMKDWVVDVECRVRLGYSPIQNLRTRLGLRTKWNRAAAAVSGGLANPKEQR